MIVDASVSIKWIYEEKSGVLAARKLLKAPERLSTCSIWLLEVGAVIERRCANGVVSADSARLAYAFLRELPIRIVNDADLADEAFDLAVKLAHPTYDCSYLALALRRDEPFVTADVRFAERASQHGYAGALQLIGPDQP